MIAAVDIFDEVEADVTALNGEIVRRAFHGNCCNFFAYQHEFNGLLAYYIALRRQIHVLKRNNRSFPLSPEAEFKMNQELWDTERMAANTRERVKNYWPCAACIWLYNPTNRIRRFPSLI